MRFSIILCLFVFHWCLSSATEGWVKRASMIFARSDFVVVAVDKYLYVLGGCDGNQTISNNCPSVTNNFTRYSFVENTWLTLTEAPRARYRYMAAAVGDYIYYIGGRDQTDSVVSEVDVYNITSGGWRTLPSQGHVTEVSDGAAFVIGHKIYVSGGYMADYTILNTTIVLDTSLQLGSGVDMFQEGVVSPKTVASGDNGAVAVGDCGYVFGGWGSDTCSPLGSVERYNSSTNTWTMIASLNHSRGDMAYTAINHAIFVIGGESKTCPSNTSYPIGEVEYFDTETSTEWKDITPIAITRFRFSAAAWGTSIYDLGGQGAEDGGHYPVLSDVYSYDVCEYVGCKTNPTVPSPATDSQIPSAMNETTTTPVATSVGTPVATPVGTPVSPTLSPTATPTKASGSMLTLSVIVVISLPVFLSIF